LRDLWRFGRWLRDRPTGMKELGYKVSACANQRQKNHDCQEGATAFLPYDSALSGVRTENYVDLIAFQTVGEDESVILGLLTGLHGLSLA
jgi:hypothetical protein